MAAPRPAVNSATLSVGFTAKVVTVRSVSADGKTAVCTDRQNTQVSVPMLVQRSKGLLPAVGETWLVTRDLGQWTFAAFVAQSAAQFQAPSSSGGVYTGATAPSDPDAGELWVNESVDNVVSVWDGENWRPLQFGAVAVQPGSLTGRQLAADANISASQVSFTAPDIGGITTTISATPPVRPSPEDLWYDAGSGYQLSQWSGAQWVPVQFGTLAIADAAITSTLIAAEAVQATHIAPGAVGSSQIATGGVAPSNIASLTASLIGPTGALNSNPYFTGGDLSGYGTYNGTLSVVSGASLPAGAPYAYAGLYTQTGQWGSASQVVPLPGSPSPYQVLVTMWVCSALTTVWVKTTPAGGSDIWYSHTVTPNTWTQISDVVTIPAGATSASIGPSCNSAASGSICFQGLLVMPQVPGGLIQAATVTPAQIASLTASLVGPTGGVLNSNPYFTGGDSLGWKTGGGAGSNATFTVTSTPPAGSGFPFAGELTSNGSGSYSMSEEGPDGPFTVINSANYVVNALVYSPTGSVRAGMNWWNNGNYVSTSFNTIAVPANTWTWVSSVVTSPAAGINRGNPFLTGNSASAYTMYAVAITVLPQVPGSLIEAGTVTAAQIAAQTITAAQLAAGIVYAGIVDATTINAATFTGSTFQGTNWIEDASGSFLYSGTPSANGLIASIAPAGGTEDYGNVYFAGTASYLHTTLPASHYLALTMDGNGFTVYTASTEAGPWTEISNISYRQFSSSAFEGLYVENHNSGVSLWLPTTGGAAFRSASLSAVDPNVTIALETWHNMTLANGWTVGSGGHARYKLMPDNTVMIDLNNLVPGTTSDGTVIWVPPAGYIPTVQQKLPLIVTYGTAPAFGSAPFLYANGSAGLEVFNLRGTISDIHTVVRYALD